MTGFESLRKLLAKGFASSCTYKISLALTSGSSEIGSASFSATTSGSSLVGSSSVLAATSVSSLVGSASFYATTSGSS